MQSIEGLLLFVMLFPLSKIADVTHTANICGPSLFCLFYCVVQSNREEKRLFSLPFLFKGFFNFLILSMIFQRVFTNLIIIVENWLT